MQNYHDLGIQEVKTVIGRYGEVDSVNGLLKNGWILLGMYVESFIFDEVNKIFSQRPCFILGRSNKPGIASPETAGSELPAERLEMASEEELDIDTIINLAGKKPGLKRFGEDFDAD